MKAKKIVHMKEDSPKILLIEDLAGYGKISLSAMIPIMSHMGYNLYNLPTALVSNTLDYGLFHMLETTGYMRETLKVWKELGFSFDAICTGMIVSEEQNAELRRRLKANTVPNWKTLPGLSNQEIALKSILSDAFLRKRNEAY